VIFGREPKSAVDFRLPTRQAAKPFTHQRCGTTKRVEVDRRNS
jgi:hypothetical protein